MGAHTEVVGGETGPEAFDSLLGNGLGEAIGDAGVGKFTIGALLLLLHLSLDVIKGKGADSGGDGSDHRATELDLEGRGVLAHSTCGDVLGGLVRHQHGHVEGGGSQHSGSGTGPE